MGSNWPAKLLILLDLFAGPPLRYRHFLGSLLDAHTVWHGSCLGVFSCTTGVHASAGDHLWQAKSLFSLDYFTTGTSGTGKRAHVLNLARTYYE